MHKRHKSLVGGRRDCPLTARLLIERPKESIFALVPPPGMDPSARKDAKVGNEDERLENSLD